MKLTKRAEQPQAGEQGNEAIRGQGLTRRAFMVNSGLVAGGAVAAGWLAPAMMQRAEAKTVGAEVPVEVKRTICSHCSVGCGVYAEVQNGVWTGQEPAFDHPFNLGGHCAKGAALREHGGQDVLVISDEQGLQLLVVHPRH